MRYVKEMISVKVEITRLMDDAQPGWVNVSLLMLTAETSRLYSLDEGEFQKTSERTASFECELS